MLRYIAKRLGMVSRAQHNAEIGDLFESFNEELRVLWAELAREREKAEMYRIAAEEYERFIGEMTRGER